MISYPYHTIFESVERYAFETPEKQALIYENSVITYDMLCSRARTVALRFLKLGVKKGDRIVYAMRGIPEFFYVYLASSMIGAVCAGIAFRNKPEAVAAIFHELMPKVAVCEDSLYTIYHSVADETSTVLIPSSELLPAMPDREMLPLLEQARQQIQLDDPFLILYTSGTTKKPKGAVLTHRNALASACMQDTHLFQPTGFTSEDVIQHCFPVNHVSGFVECGFAPLYGGGSLILQPDFHPQRVLENTEKHRATVLCGVPAMWTKIIEALEGHSYDLSSVRVGITGASVLSRVLAEKMEKICPVLENPLGMTETSGFCSYPSANGEANQHETVGRVMPELQHKLIDAQGLPVKPGEIGQLCYKGDSVISGYVSQSLPVDSDGYFLAGDMAYEDGKGHLHLCGRNDDMFTVGGYNVFPQEIEDVLLRYPGVTGAAVLPIPHHSMGNICRAYLTVQHDVDLQRLEQFAADEMIYYKVPKNYVILDSFPVNALGKIAKTVLAGQIKEEFKDNGEQK